jgi:hypothetical protein
MDWCGRERPGVGAPSPGARLNDLCWGVFALFAEQEDSGCHAGDYACNDTPHRDPNYRAGTKPVA